MPEDDPGDGTMPLGESSQPRVESHYVSIVRGAAALLTQASAKPGMSSVYDYMNNYLPDTLSNNEQHDMRPS